VGLLTGGPFPAGAAKIVGVAEDGTVTDVATGLTMCTDVAIGPDGQMYAVQISLNFLQEVPDPGNVVRVFANGTTEPVVEGLMLPNGIAFDTAGNLYIATGTVTPPGMDPAGMVLRIDGVAPPA
jgi:sugar lactone lactonase YvrE